MHVLCRRPAAAAPQFVSMRHQWHQNCGSFSGGWVAEFVRIPTNSRQEGMMFKPARILAFVAACGLSIAVVAPRAVAKDSDEYWSGYWKWYDGPYRNYYNRPHDLRYGNSQPTLYYGHAPPPSYNGADPPYQRGEPPHIGNYTPIYGPGHYYGPPIAPYYAPGRDRYAGVRYGWW